MEGKATSRPETACHDHPLRAARRRCSSCDRTLCDECYRFRLGERPACARCAYEVNTRPQRRLSLAVAFLGFSWGAGVWALRRYDLWNQSPLYVVLGAVVVVCVTVALLYTARDPSLPAVSNRVPGDEADGDLEPSGNPFRARARRVLQAASPRVSGKLTAFVVGVCLVSSAALLPRAMRLPRWLEVEAVLGVWWLVTATTLTTLLFRGWRLADDYVYFLPWGAPAKPDPALPGGGTGQTSAAPAPVAEPKPPSKAWSLADGCTGCDGCSGVDGEGLLAMLVVGALAVVALGAAWVFVEVAAPLLFLAMYAVLMRALGRVANDKHGCEGSALKAFAWGALWASVYVAPLAGLVYLFHAVHRR